MPIGLLIMFFAMLSTAGFVGTAIWVTYFNNPNASTSGLVFGAVISVIITIVSACITGDMWEQRHKARLVRKKEERELQIEMMKEE
jgi:hypothetical protein